MVSSTLRSRRRRRIRVGPGSPWADVSITTRRCDLNRGRGQGGRVSGAARCSRPVRRRGDPSGRTSVDLKIGYKASAEQFGPRDLVEYAVRAEEVGLDSVTVSDHFLPWRHNGGHAPLALAGGGGVGGGGKRGVVGKWGLTPPIPHQPAGGAPA